VVGEALVEGPAWDWTGCRRCLRRAAAGAPPLMLPLRVQGVRPLLNQLDC